MRHVDAMRFLIIFVFLVKKTAKEMKKGRCKRMILKCKTKDTFVTTVWQRNLGQTATHALLGCKKKGEPKSVKLVSPHANHYFIKTPLENSTVTFSEFK